MAYQVTELAVNVKSKTMVDPLSSYNPPLFSKVLRFFYTEILVLGVSFLNDDNSAVIDWVAGDEFELSIDVDFLHTSDNGTLDQAYSGAVTSIEVTFEEDPGVISTPGSIQLRNDNDEREIIDYTTVSGTGVSRTFTVSDTLTYSYASGDFCGIVDDLMVYSDDSQVDIVDDWDDVDRANGKLSFRVNCGRYEFVRKLEREGLDLNNELVVNFEIKRKPSGESFWSVVCQDTVYARNVVRDIEN